MRIKNILQQIKGLAGWTGSDVPDTLNLGDIYKLRRDVYSAVSPNIKKITRWTVEDGLTSVQNESLGRAFGAYKQLLISGLTDDVGSLTGSARDVTQSFQNEVRNILKIPSSRGISALQYQMAALKKPEILDKYGFGPFGFGRVSSSAKLDQMPEIWGIDPAEVSIQEIAIGLDLKGMNIPGMEDLSTVDIARRLIKNPRKYKKYIPKNAWDYIKSRSDSSSGHRRIAGAVTLTARSRAQSLRNFMVGTFVGSSKELDQIVDLLDKIIESDDDRVSNRFLTLIAQGRLRASDIMDVINQLRTYYQNKQSLAETRRTSANKGYAWEELSDDDDSGYALAVKQYLQQIYDYLQEVL